METESHPSAAPTKIESDLATVQADMTSQKAERAAAIALTVRSWVNKQMANSPISRNVDAWNHLQASIPALIASLQNGA